MKSASTTSRYIRGLMSLLVGSAILWIFAQRSHGGIKGMPIPLINVLISFACATAAAFVCKRCWLAFAVPFVAALVGVFATGRWYYGPFGGVLGLLVGLLVLLVPGNWHREHQTTR